MRRSESARPPPRANHPCDPFTFADVLFYSLKTTSTSCTLIWCYNPVLYDQGTLLDCPGCPLGPLVAWSGEG